MDTKINILNKLKSSVILNAVVELRWAASRAAAPGTNIVQWCLKWHPPPMASTLGQQKQPHGIAAAAQTPYCCYRSNKWGGQGRPDQGASSSSWGLFLSTWKRWDFVTPLIHLPFALSIPSSPALSGTCRLPSCSPVGFSQTVNPEPCLLYL